MAVTVQTVRTAISRNTAAENTYVFSLSSNATAGATLVLVVTADNSASAGSSNNISGVTDSKGNTWSTIRQAPLYDNGAASAGIQGGWFDTNQSVGTLTTSDTITVAFSGTTTVARAVVVYQITPETNGVIQYVTGGVGPGETAANGQITTATVQIGQVVFAAYHSENVNAVTGDSDTTNGTWATQETTTVGTGIAGIRHASQYKIQTTAASTQSYDVTVASQDRIVSYVLYKQYFQNSFTANAVIRKTTSSTLTADAFVRGWFRIDAFVQASFSASSILRKTQSSTFTTDAFVKGWLTADARIAGRFLVDAIKRETQSTGKAILFEATSKRTQSGSFSINTWIEATIKLDATVRRIEEKTFPAEADLLRAIEGSTAADAIKFETVEVLTRTADAVLHVLQSSAFTVDAWVGFTIDAVIAGGSEHHEGNFTAESTVIEWGVWSETWWNTVSEATQQNFSVQAILLKTITPTGPFADAAILRNSGTLTFPVDAVIWATISSADKTADAAIKATISVADKTADAVLWRSWTVSDRTIDAAILRTWTVSNKTIDAIIWRTITVATTTADAVIWKTIQTSDKTLDAVLLRTQEGSFAAEAIVSRSEQGAIAADAVIVGSQAGQFAADAAIRRTQTGSTSADAFIAGWFTVDAQLVGYLPVDAILLRTQEGSFSAEAWIPGVGLGAFTEDAAIRWTKEESAKADAAIRREEPGAFITDALVKASLGGFLAVDAVVASTSVSQLAADAVLAKTVTGAYPADAAIRMLQEGDLTAEAWIGVPFAAVFYADAITVRAQTAAFVVDALVARTSSATITADAVFAGIFGLDATILKTAGASVTADAITAETRTVGFGADACIRSLGSASFTADANISGAALQQSFPADAWITAPGYGTFGIDASISLAYEGSISATWAALIIEGSWSAATIDATWSVASIDATWSISAIDATWAADFIEGNFNLRHRKESFTADASIS